MQNIYKNVIYESINRNSPNFVIQSSHKPGNHKSQIVTRNRNLEPQF